MQYIILTKMSGGGYFQKDTNSAELEILGNFLRVDVGSNWISSWRDWIKNPEDEDVASNATFLEKEEGDIIIGYLYTDDYYEFLFETTQEQLLEILDRWEELCKQEPERIIITKEGDRVTLEGRD